MTEEKKSPPLGIKPKKIHDQERAFDILEAMTSYVGENLTIPKEWFEELEYLYMEAN